MKSAQVLKPLYEQLQRQVSIAPLVTFRIMFGLMMFAGTVRFWSNGWISDLYVTPIFYFPYTGFQWVCTLGSNGMYFLFAILLLSSILICLGWFYKTATTLFFLIFTYIELIDATNYLNHYYLISLLGFLMIWLPANRSLSLDVKINPACEVTEVPLWTIGILRLQIALVYLFAGLAKLNPSWLLDALPLKIWLPANSHLPLIGNLMYEHWLAYLFSWFGALYDLFIVFFLIFKKTRTFALFVVLIFHLCTAIFFPVIGMFPYIMIVSSLLFCGSGSQKIFLEKIKMFFKRSSEPIKKSSTWNTLASPKLLVPVLCTYFLLQCIVPFRYLAYPGDVFWTEEGYRFSWRVMLMEKSGNIFFSVKESETGRTFEVDNKEYLTPLQEKMMSTQPDMILRYAHYLKEVFQKKGIKDPAIYAEGYVALNGERSQLFTDTSVNLAKKEVGWKHYDWILSKKTYDR